jgi:hypothetical protein
LALTLTFDYAQNILTEPGYHRFISTRELSEQGEPSDAASHLQIFRDEPTKTVMLRPMQLDPTFLNSPAAGRQHHPPLGNGRERDRHGEHQHL